MPEIAAANNLTIQFDSAQWSLRNGSDSIVSATREGIFYQPTFAQARRLPSESTLTPDQFTMIVAGFASEDSSWYLGLLLSPEVAQARGGRWCGLARWDAHDSVLAEQAGLALADILEKPFRLVPPTQEQAPTVVESAPEGAETRDLGRVEEPVTLLGLPIHLNEWILEEDQVGLHLKRSRVYNRGIIWRAIFFAILTPIFAALSIGALLSVFAPVQPEWLPYLGLGITLVLLVITLSQIMNALRNPLILVDRRARLMRSMVRNGSRTVVQSPFEGLEYILISHMTNRRKAVNNVPQPTEGAPDVPPVPAGPAAYNIWGEMWIHVFSPRRGFIEVCHSTDIEGWMLASVPFNERRPLNLREINSPVHHAATWIGREIDNLPIYVEER